MCRRIFISVFVCWKQTIFLPLENWPDIERFSMCILYIESIDSHTCESRKTSIANSATSAVIDGKNASVFFLCGRFRAKEFPHLVQAIFLWHKNGFRYLLLLVTFSNLMFDAHTQKTAAHIRLVLVTTNTTKYFYGSKCSFPFVRLIDALSSEHFFQLSTPLNT